MRIGDLRHRVTLQIKTVTRDAAGGEVVTWADHATVWAARLPLGIRWREYFAAQRLNYEASTKFVLRFRQLVAPGSMRVVCGGKTFEIMTVIDDGKWDWLELICSEVQA